jgi:hypothetical protein
VRNNIVLKRNALREAIRFSNENDRSSSRAKVDRKTSPSITRSFKSTIESLERIDIVPNLAESLSVFCPRFGRRTTMLNIYISIHGKFCQIYTERFAVYHIKPWHESNPRDALNERTRRTVRNTSLSRCHGNDRTTSQNCTHRWRSRVTQFIPFGRLASVGWLLVQVINPGLTPFVLRTSIEAQICGSTYRKILGHCSVVDRKSCVNANRRLSCVADSPVHQLTLLEIYSTRDADI